MVENKENEIILLRSIVNIYNRLCLTRMEIIEDLAIFTRNSVEDAIEKGIEDPPREVEEQYEVFVNEVDYIEVSKETLKKEMKKIIDKYKIEGVEFIKDTFIFSEIEYIVWEEAFQNTIKNIQELLRRAKSVYEERDVVKGPIN